METQPHTHEFYTQCFGFGGHVIMCSVPGCLYEEYEGPCPEAGTFTPHEEGESE